MIQRKLKFDRALLPAGWAQGVEVSVGEDGLITAVAAGVGGGSPDGVLAIPGMANLHSHAHQRLMQGLAERAGPGPDSFWTWREVMYGFALRLSPDDLEAVAAQLYVEMLEAGFTAVGEFQYLHHQPDGRPYDNRAELSLRCLAAAEQAGIAVTLLPVLYSHGGFGGQPPSEGQRRFITTPEGFLDIHERLASASAGRQDVRLGMAPHSLRAVTQEGLTAVLAGRSMPGPVHIHVAEQVKEVEDCLAWCGERPVEHLLRHYPAGRHWCAIHATQMTAAETRELAASGVIAGLCPLTEANLGDGIFPAPSFIGSGGAFGIGSDSHISVSVAEELRMLEYSQRLRDRTRNALADGPLQSTGRSLLDRALTGGAQALDQPMGAIAAGLRADIVVLDHEDPGLMGRSGDAGLDSWIFSAGNRAVRDVYCGGRQVVRQGRHVNADAIRRRFLKTVERLS